MRKQHSLLHFIFGFGVGAVVGFVLRNMESTEYNTGYQPKTEVFKEDDYFTDDVIKQHQEEKAARHLAKEANASKIQLHVPQYKDQSSDIHDNVEVMPEAEHEVMHDEAPEEAVEGTVEEIADDGVSEGLEALKEAVADEDR